MAFTFSGQLTKKNSNISISDKARQYALNEIWQNQDTIWSFLSAAVDGVGASIYERIANYVQNVKDIDRCGIDELHSIAHELDSSSIHLKHVSYPIPLQPLMDIFSVDKNVFLTSGAMLDDSSLVDITGYLKRDTVEYFDIVTGLLSGSSLSADILSSSVILDIDYLTGFIEPYLSAHLISYATYSGEGTYGNLLLQDEAEKNADIYIGFMDSIYSNPASEWGETTSGEIIEECTHTLRNICVSTVYDRIRLKEIAQTNALIGTSEILEKVSVDYILRALTKRGDWNFYVKPSGALESASVNDAYELEQARPGISDINTYFSVDVVEYYDNTEYLNISAASPFVNGITGYAALSSTSAYLDISGNYIETDIVDATGQSLYGEGLCGYIVTGGNARYWEGDAHSDNLLESEMTSATLSSFFSNILGMSGDMDDFEAFQSSIFDNYSPSGLDRLGSTIVDLSATSLSDAHYKYINNISGDIVYANHKNTEYPTIAAQPYLWNLIEKEDGFYPEIHNMTLESELTVSHETSGSISISGDLVSSWKRENQDIVGYITSYEYDTNLDYVGREDTHVEIDGPFYPPALTALISGQSVSGNYLHIASKYADGLTDKLTNQYALFTDDIIALNDYVIYEYQIDTNNHHYMLYKPTSAMLSGEVTSGAYNGFGKVMMRYRHHPLPFPITNDSEELSQLYTRKGLGLGLDDILNGRCYDFGIYNDIYWVYGTDITDTNSIIIFGAEYKIFPEYSATESVFTVKVDNTNLPSMINLTNITDFIGVYSHRNYLIFVYYVGWLDTDTVQIGLKHYNIYTKTIDDTDIDIITIGGVRPIAEDNINNNEVTKLTVSDDILSIAYECEPSNTTECLTENSICTIDLIKDNIDSSTAIINEWWNINT